jgi:hypothetical protein
VTSLILVGGGKIQLEMNKVTRVVRQVSLTALGSNTTIEAKTLEIKKIVLRDATTGNNNINLVDVYTVLVMQATERTLRSLDANITPYNVAVLANKPTDNHFSFILGLILIIEILLYSYLGNNMTTSFIIMNHYIAAITPLYILAVITAILGLIAYNYGEYIHQVITAGNRTTAVSVNLKRTAIKVLLCTIFFLLIAGTVLTQKPYDFEEERKTCRSAFTLTKGKRGAQKDYYTYDIVNTSVVPDYQLLFDKLPSNSDVRQRLLRHHPDKLDSSADKELHAELYQCYAAALECNRSIKCYSQAAVKFDIHVNMNLPRMYNAEYAADSERDYTEQQKREKREQEEREEAEWYYRKQQACKLAYLKLALLNACYSLILIIVFHVEAVKVIHIFAAYKIIATNTQWQAVRTAFYLCIVYCLLTIAAAVQSQYTVVVLHKLITEGSAARLAPVVTFATYLWSCLTSIYILYFAALLAIIDIGLVPLGYCQFVVAICTKINYILSDLLLNKYFRKIAFFVTLILSMQVITAKPIYSNNPVRGYTTYRPHESKCIGAFNTQYQLDDEVVFKLRTQEGLLMPKPKQH